MSFGKTVSNNTDPTQINKQDTGLRTGGDGPNTMGKEQRQDTWDFLNPFKRGDHYREAAIPDAVPINAPTWNPADYTGAGTVAQPGAMTGGTIAKVHDPRSVLIDGKAQAEWRSQQMTLAQQLAEQAAGRGPSLAGEQLRQGMKANQAATFAQLASQRGGPSAGNARASMMASAAIQGQTNRDAATARMQEQMTAREQLNQVITSGREMDITMATNQAKLEQETALEKYRGDLQRAIEQGKLDQRTAEAMFAEANNNARANAQIAADSARQFNDIRLKYITMGLDQQVANQRAALEVEAMRRAEKEKSWNSKLAAESERKQRAGKTIGAIVGAMAGGGQGAQAGMAGGGAAAGNRDAGGTGGVNGADTSGDMSALGSGNSGIAGGTSGGGDMYTGYQSGGV